MNKLHKKDIICYALSHSMFGSELKDSDIQALASVCSLRTVEKNAYLFRQEEPAIGFFIVHSGAIKVHRILPDGREQVINIFNPLESFAEIVLGGTMTYPVSAAAVENSQVVCVESDKLRGLISRIPDISLRIMASMSLHLRFLVSRLEQQKYQQADSRLAGWLFEQLSDSTSESFKLTIKKKILAAQLGITSETLSRTLLQFKKKGWIDESGQELKLLNKAALLQCQQGTG